jgi:hypothetical protein
MIERSSTACFHPPDGRRLARHAERIRPIVNLYDSFREWRGAQVFEQLCAKRLFCAESTHNAPLVAWGAIQTLAARISLNPAKPGFSAPLSLSTSNPADGALRRVRRR